MTPEEIQQMQQLQMMLAQQQAAPQQQMGQQQIQRAMPSPVTAVPQSSGNPVLIGNDALRQQFAEHPELAPPNSAQWLDQREQHLLGNDAPPIITATAPAAPAPPPMLPQAPQVQAPPQPPAPNLPQSPPMLPPALPAPPQQMIPGPLPNTPPAPSLPPASAPQLPTPAQITQLPQQAPVMSQVSPAPKVDAAAHINNDVTMPQQTFNPAYQPPPLPTLLNASLIQNNPYKSAPVLPGYAQPRPGTSFMAPHAAPQMPSFDNPFAGPQFTGAGGLTAGTVAQQPYSDNLFARLMQPNFTSYS